MKHLAAALLCLLFPALGHAAEPGRVFKTEYVAFETREESRALDRESCERYLPFLPSEVRNIGGMSVIRGKIQVPHSWSDSDVFLHLENVGTAYDLAVNGTAVARVEDSHTPADFLISPCLNEGSNDVVIVLRNSSVPQIFEGVGPTARQSLENSYVVSRRKVGIRDFDVELRPDSLKRFGVLDLKVLVGNSYNYEEPLTIGFDIYSPQGKLLDYSVKDVTIPGRSVDTVRFSPYIYHTYENKWGDGRAPLYQLTLYIKVGGIPREYIPLKIGFGHSEFENGRIVRFDQPVDIRAARYNAAADRQTTRREIASLKSRGYNTLCPDYPQPDFFYDLCDEIGIYVIDRAAINAPSAGDDRTPGGTPSNDPALVGEYLSRVQSMYARSHNRTCVIAYELGGPSGNGYNMYKAYQWLKSVEKSRPVIYSGADGEWNTDNVNYTAE
ncbi:MAG: hypothetical protein J1D86_06080 [Alistipes sp.]|nr:hypothetical protein [Alistipes sp.]